MVPLRGDFVGDTGMSVGQFGLLIGLVGIPAALLATLSGSLVDRIGPRTMLITSALIAAIPNFAYGFLHDPYLFLLFRPMEGIAFSITLAAGPAFIMRTTQGKRQVAAMTFWSTATPAAISIGLLVGGAFAGTANWRGAFLVYALALVGAALLGLLLPRLPGTHRGSLTLSAHLHALLAGYRQSEAVRLGTQLFLIAAASLGLNAILPGYLAQTHDLSVAAASGVVAGANLAMIAGAILLGVLMARGMAPRYLLIAFAGCAIGAATLVLWPRTSIGEAGILFAVWSLMVGASQALVFVMLPRIADPEAPGLATGVINQLSSLSSFVAPMIFLFLLPKGWPFVVAVIATCWLMGIGLFWTIRKLR